MSNLSVGRDLGAILGTMILKEQTTGEIRGLRELSVLIQDRKSQLELKTKKPDPKVEDKLNEQVPSPRDLSL